MTTMRIAIFFLLAGCLGCGGSNPTSSNNSGGPTSVSDSQYTTTSSGLKYFDLTVGNGTVATSGNVVTAHYDGWLQNGQKFDSSHDRGQPFVFPLGSGAVIPGWDEGVAGMRIGSKRQLVIPSSLAYGATGAPPAIPPNATLIFEVEVLAVD
ncbi:MAG: FKBP-type peptidyl-prolyl cis-trans isomerase [Candidatus Latescibacteria bacterium]|jgi:FKBP-type peptidyl-prolyl cis-trans isomerase|nr:FKBP-type peptidyl-prolyl cis-trans isomerase [Candidatus Latescibacterota bacterium]